MTPTIENRHVMLARRGVQPALILLWAFTAPLANQDIRWDPILTDYKHAILPPVPRDITSADQTAANVLPERIPKAVRLPLVPVAVL